MSTPPAVTLMQATLADLPLLADWMRGLRCDDPMPAGTLADDKTAMQAMTDLLADGRLGTAWIIRRSDMAVGYAVLTFVHSIEFGGRCAFLDELYVAPDHRGGGIGRATLRLLEAEAVVSGVRVLLLEASPENERANRLYHSAGFVPRKYRLLGKRPEQNARA